MQYDQSREQLVPKPSASTASLIANPELQQKVAPLLTDLVRYLLKKKPTDPVPHILQFLKDREGLGEPELSADERVELEQLRTHYNQLKSKLDSTPAKEKGAAAGSDDSDAEESKDAPKKKAKADSSSDSEVSGDEVGELAYMAPPQASNNRQRTSVSAEVFGRYNKKADFVPTIIPKSDEIKAKIEQRLKTSFMFKALGDDEMKIVVDAMQGVDFKAGETVITEGEPGSVLYVCETGQLDCSKKLTPGSDAETYLKTYEPGDAFGELALLYNAPRAATIKAKSDCHLWQLDRNTFNHIVKDASQQKREKYETFLSSVPILQNIDVYERSKICDSIKEHSFTAGSTVITEGEEGNVFFIIIEGEAVATKTLNAGAAPQEVMQYKAGDYFGELALLKSGVREANVMAKTQLKVASMDRDSFKRLLGPLDEILKRNMEAYNKFVTSNN